MTVVREDRAEEAEVAYRAVMVAIDHSSTGPMTCCATAVTSCQCQLNSIRDVNYCTTEESYRKPGKVFDSRTSATLFLGVSVSVALSTSPICWGLALTIDANASASSNSSLDAVAELGAEWFGADRTCCSRI
jgi:hypothetical protein